MNKSTSPARTRVAPSPTGHMHLGTARTALYDYLLAKKTGGQFILRIEDTDTRRTVPGAVEEIINGLRWLGIPFDEGPDVGGPKGPYRQTERREIYKEHAELLVEKGSAYPCFCTPQELQEMRERQKREKAQYHYEGVCRDIDPAAAGQRIANGEKYVVRFKMPRDGATVAVDHLRGEIVTENQYLDDYVLLKSDGLPTYHLAAIVDDHLMGITHVLRGAEWLPTFPLHVNIVRAFGWQEPTWVHLSVFLKPSGKGKMSKREAATAQEDGYSIFVKDLEGLGYTPEGVLNWIALMGWGVPEDDLMSLDEMVERFDVDRLTASPAAINFAKLDHFNGAHIRRLKDEALAARLKPFYLQAGYTVDDSILLAIIPLLRERMVTLDDCIAFGGFFFEEEISPVPEQLIAKGLDAVQSAEIARQAYAIMEKLPEITLATAEAPLRDLVERLELKPNQVFGILRVATTGQMVSPPLFESMQVIGREKVLERVRRAIELLEEMSR
jgi:glutamyl-tRNA synthetase